MTNEYKKSKDGKKLELEMVETFNNSWTRGEIIKQLQYWQEKLNAADLLGVE